MCRKYVAARDVANPVFLQHARGPVPSKIQGRAIVLHYQFQTGEEAEVYTSYKESLMAELRALKAEQDHRMECAICLAAFGRRLLVRFVVDDYSGELTGVREVTRTPAERAKYESLYF